MKTLILTGPTATGKTALALRLATERPGQLEIINADSMLVYRGMDIGTAKPTPEERQQVPHHLIDIRDPDEGFTAGDFKRLVEESLSQIHARGRQALVVGGTGFYLKALLYGLWEAPPTDPDLRKELEKGSNQDLFTSLQEKDPASALKIGPNDRYRLIRALEIIALSGKNPSELAHNLPKTPDPRWNVLGVDLPENDLYSRIQARTTRMLEQGLVEETRGLVARYPNARPLDSVGYFETCRYLRGEPPQGRKIREGVLGLQDEIEVATRQLVKRQRTWFRGQKEIEWLPSTPEERIQALRQLLP